MAGLENVNLDEQVDRLQKEIAGIRSDVGNLLTAFKDVSLEKGEAALGRAREAGEVIRGQATEAQRQVGHYIEERPLASVLMAFGTGFVLGSLISFRR